MRIDDRDHPESAPGAGWGLVPGDSQGGPVRRPAGNGTLVSTMASPCKIAVLLGAASLLGAAGCGATVQGKAARQASAPQGGGAPASPGSRIPALGGAAAPVPRHLSALAAKLGVPKDRLRAALASIRPPGGSSGSPTAGRLAGALAKALGLPPTRVQAALDAVLARGGTSGANGARAPPASPA
jgi:hypothetical protein